MKEKIFEWAKESNIEVKQVDRICMGGIITWYVVVERCIIHEVDFRKARLKGFHIEAMEVATALNGKFEGFILWINEIKGE